MKAGELLEKLLEYELLGECKGVHVGQRYIEELASFAGEDVVIANVTVVNAALGDQDTTALHVWSAHHFFIISSIKLLPGKGVKTNGPVTLHDKVDFGDISLFLQNISV